METEDIKNFPVKNSLVSTDRMFGIDNAGLGFLTPQTLSSLQTQINTMNTALVGLQIAVNTIQASTEHIGSWTPTGDGISASGGEDHNWFHRIGRMVRIGGRIVTTQSATAFSLTSLPIPCINDFSSTAIAITLQNSRIGRIQISSYGLALIFQSPNIGVGETIYLSGWYLTT